MSALEIEPIQGMVALQLVDGDEDEPEVESGSGSNDSYNEAIFAIVVGIGPKGPPGVKKGTTVLVRKYARDGLKLGDGVVLCDTYCIVGRVKS